MSKRTLGWLIPLVIAGFTLAGSWVISPRPSIKWGIFVGVVIALAQSFASTAALQWAWEKAFFYWVWGGGILVRLFVLALTAFVVIGYTDLSLVATLLTMVSSTTLFLVVESVAFI